MRVTSYKRSGSYCPALTYSYTSQQQEWSIRVRLSIERKTKKKKKKKTYERLLCSRDSKEFDTCSQIASDVSSAHPSNNQQHCKNESDKDDDYGISRGYESHKKEQWFIIETSNGKKAPNNWQKHRNLQDSKTLWFDSRCVWYDELIFLFVLFFVVIGSYHVNLPLSQREMTAWDDDCSNHRYRNTRSRIFHLLVYAEFQWFRTKSRTRNSGRSLSYGNTWEQFLSFTRTSRLTLITRRYRRTLINKYNTNINKISAILKLDRQEFLKGQ